jgi:hypothetical protein
MNKFPLIAILTFLSFVIGVSSAPDFDIVEDHVNGTSSAGQTLSSGLTFTVNNTGTTNLDINFTGYILTLTDGADQINITSLGNITNMANDTTLSRTFSVPIPSQQTPGLYTGTLSATSNATPSSTAEDTITINVNVTSTYSVSTSPSSQINLGSVSLNTTYNGTFDITNTGNDAITNVFFEFSNSGFNLQTANSNFTLTVDETKTIGFNITIPASSSTGNITLGSINLVSTELNADLFDVKAQVGGGLIIEDLDIFLTTRKSKSESDLDVQDGKKLNFDDEDVGPESELRFNFNIENTFTDDDDIDIDDITIKVTIEEIDDGDDIDEESDEFSLDSDSSRDEDIIIKIPLTVNVGVFDVIIEVSGQDDDGNEHTAQMDLRIDVDKEARDVIVSKALVFPDKVKCSGSSTLTATIKNLGVRTETEAGIEIINSDLDLNFVKQYIELDEDPFESDNEFSKKIIINVDKDTAAGTYPIKVNSYIHKDALWETKTTNLIVEACSGQVEEEEDQEETINGTETVDVGEDQEEETTEGTEVPVLEPTTTTEVSLTKKPIFWVLMAILNFIVIVSIAFLIVKAVGKKQ